MSFLAKAAHVHRELRFTLQKLALAREMPFEGLSNQLVPSGLVGESQIPNVVYQTWETNEFGKQHRQSLGLFRQLNPDCTFYMLDRNARDDYMESRWGADPLFELYSQSKFGPLQVDIFRYCIIYDKGGFYFDINKGVSVPFDSLIKAGTTGLVTFENNMTDARATESANSLLLEPLKRVVNWGFGFSPRHKLLEIVLDDLRYFSTYCKGQVFPSPKEAIVSISGPGVMTRALHKYLEAPNPSPVTQLRTDFAGAGIFNLPGSWVRYHQVRGYAHAKNDSIFETPGR